jgi:hypothetical protein
MEEGHIILRSTGALGVLDPRSLGGRGYWGCARRGEQARGHYGNR